MSGAGPGPGGTPRLTAGGGPAGPANQGDHDEHELGGRCAPGRLARDPDSGRRNDRFGGINWGSTFFGFTLVLTALAEAAGTTIGLANSAGAAGQAVDRATQAGQNPVAPRPPASKPYRCCEIARRED
jgi:hypothetical protein